VQAILIAVALVMVAVVGVYFLFLAPDKGKGGDNNAEDEIPLLDGRTYDPLASDPVIQGKWGVGSKFIYTCVAEKEDGVDVPITDPTVTMMIVGQSGSYYVLGGDTGADAFAMIHKQTGAMAYSKQIGNDSFVYEGKKRSLITREYVAVYMDRGDAGISTSFILSTDPNDAILYKAYMKTRYYDITVPEDTTREVFLVLSSYTIVPPTEFIPSPELGEGYVYGGSGTSPSGNEVSGSISLACVADGPGDTRFAMVVTDVRDGMVVQKMIEFGDFDSSVYSTKEGVFDYLVQGMTPTGLTETISTINGNVICDVYEDAVGPTIVERAFVGVLDGIVYLVGTYDVVDPDPILAKTLVRILPA